MRLPRLFDTLSEIHLLLDIGFVVWTFGFVQQLGRLLSAHRIFGGRRVGCPMIFFNRFAQCGGPWLFCDRFCLLVVVHGFATDLHTSGLNVKLNEHSDRLHLTVQTFTLWTWEQSGFWNTENLKLRVYTKVGKSCFLSFPSTHSWHLPLIFSSEIWVLVVHQQQKLKILSQMFLWVESNFGYYESWP
jgi:hypothetical protein